MGAVAMVKPHFQQLFSSTSVFITLALAKLLTEEKKKKLVSLEEMLPKSSLHHMLSGSCSVKHRNNCFSWTETLISSS